MAAALLSARSGHQEWRRPSSSILPLTGIAALKPKPGGGGDGSFTARLPRVQPNVNKRGQQIMVAHMRGAARPHEHSNRSVEDCDSPEGEAHGFEIAPVLNLLDGTASRMAISHDISHCADYKPLLKPRIPPSLIPEKDHIYETSFLPTDPSSFYNEENGLWCTKVFPSTSPSGREDAARLDAWISKALEETGHEMQQRASNGEKVEPVEVLVPVLSIALQELTRQVSHECVERGRVLDKIWRTYLELFERVLKLMREALKRETSNACDVTSELMEARRALAEMKKNHPDRVHTAVSELDAQFAELQEDFEYQMEAAQVTNGHLRAELRRNNVELQRFFPYFQLYADSYLKHHLPMPQVTERVREVVLMRKTLSNSDLEDETPSPRPKGMDGGSRESKEALETGEIKAIPAARAGATAPEVAFAEDFKRLLAVLKPEQRRFIGQELGPVMMDDSADGERNIRGRKKATAEDRCAEQLKNLQCDVQKQELRIAELESQIVAAQATS